MIVTTLAQAPANWSVTLPHTLVVTTTLMGVVGQVLVSAAWSLELLEPQAVNVKAPTVAAAAAITTKRERFFGVLTFSCLSYLCFA